MDRRLGASVAIVLVPVLSLSCWLLGYAWLTYGRVDDSVRSVQALRMTSLAMEKTSAECGPTNGVLGENLPVPAERGTVLQRMRATSDEYAAQLLDALGPERCPGREVGIQVVRRAQTHLAVARANIDRLTALPLCSRSSDGLADGVDRMIAVIPKFLPIVNARTANITRGDPDVLSCLTLTRLSADLREYADQLGSRFTGALAMYRMLTFDEQLAIERTQGRVDQLRSMIETRVGGRAPLNQHALATLGAQYFGDRSRYVAAVCAKASQLGGVDITLAAFAKRYVPTMCAITDFRGIVLRLADDDIREHRRVMLLVLMGSAGAVVLVLGALTWMTISFRRNVVGPFVNATRLIDGIARGNLSVYILTDFVWREIRAMFDAIRVLCINSVERRRLEVERTHLMRELSRMAETGSLIQLLNRRAFEDHADAIYKSPQPKARLIALIMFGIGHFKRINGTYGHAVGDEALHTVARLCRAEGPSADMVARIGGGGFAVMVWADSLAQARAVADHLRHRIAEVTVPTGTDLLYRMTASFGVATAPAADGPQLGPPLRRAGHLLYAARLAGRNCAMADRPLASPDAALAAD